MMQGTPGSPAAASLRSLLDDVPVVALEGDPEVRVSAITYDSRLAGPGTLFIAYEGVYQDVHLYIPDALARGAAAVLVERPIAELRAELGLPAEATLVQVPDARRARGLVAAALYGHPSRDMVVVGVTGTDGKTTTSTLVHAMVTAAGRRAGVVTTVAAHIGDEAIDTGLHVTTPDPEDLQALLARMRAEGMEVAVLEVTSHGLAQHRVTGIDFDIGVITNITHEALEYHGTFEAYREAKAMLFHALADHPSHSGVPHTAVLNAADDSFELLQAIPVERHATYSVTGEADYRAEAIEHTPAGLRFQAVTPQGVVDIASPLLGAYNVANLLAAMAASAPLGAGPESWRAGAAAVHGIAGRMEVIDEGQAFMAIVDFAHTPNALQQALATTHELVGPGGRVIAVFGCAGLRDPTKRAMMGRVAGEMADLTIVTAEDPRTEDLDAIIDAVAVGLHDAGAHEGEGFRRVPDRGEAIRQACAEARRGDVVIICGKGHEKSMCFGDTEWPWDDREALRAALRGTPYRELPTAIRRGA